MTWAALDGGATLGTRGSETGTIVRDDEHTLGARITLENDTAHAPFAITCGIYGWMCHTRYFASSIEAEAEYEKMRTRLAEILAIIPMRDDPQVRAKGQAVSEAIGEFIEQFP
jgi:hypothetical protein